MSSRRPSQTAMATARREVAAEAAIRAGRTLRVSVRTDASAATVSRGFAERTVRLGRAVYTDATCTAIAQAAL